METMEVIIENYGILTSMSWNSNKWAAEPSQQDLRTSNYGFVKDKAYMHESLNFGHELYPAEEDGYYIGYTPLFNRPPDVNKSRNVDILFLMSSDYQNSNRKSIIGFYGFPDFGQKYYRDANHPLFQRYDSGNFKSEPDNIIYFENPIIIDNDSIRKLNLLPDGKLIGQRGFNYLNSDNVYNLITIAQQLNPNNQKLDGFVKKFPLLVETTNENINLYDFYQVVGDSDADTTKGIMELEKKMAKQTPEIKQRISNYIERGSIANKVKVHTGYKCLVCEAMGQDPYSFKKPNGKYYVETHHIEPVSTLKKGVLSINNLITVCANHHRQFHYGDVQVLEHTPTSFKFSIDGSIVAVKAIKLG